MRTGVLKLHDLTIKDFSSMEDAMKGADQLIAFQRQNQIAVEVWQQHRTKLLAISFLTVSGIARTQAFGDDLIG